MLGGVPIVLVTGMSGTGKSTALVELAQRGFRTVDTDEPGWSTWSERAGGYVWDEDLIGELLATENDPALYLSGTVSNQGRFYPRFDAIVLLSAPPAVLLSRLASRTTNRYGKTADERDLILQHFAEVEPLLRKTCTHEIDATQPIGDVVAKLIEIATQTASLPPTLRATHAVRAPCRRRVKGSAKRRRCVPQARPSTCYFETGRL